MDGSIILRRLAALSRSRITQTAPARYFDGGYRRIKRCGRTNGRTFDLPRSILGAESLRFQANAVANSLPERAISFFQLRRKENYY